MAEGEFDVQHDGDRRIAASNSVVENGVEEEPSFSDEEGFVDDISESELLGDLLLTKPRESDGLENVIVVDKIPQVGPDRQEKLKNVLSKLFSKAGEIVKEHYVLDEKGHTLGYMFIEYKTAEAAAEAVKTFDKHRLDKTHVFVVNLFNDIEKYSSIPEKWEKPEPNKYVDRGNLKSWLQNEDAFDQFSVIHETGAVVSIYLNSNPEPKKLMERPGWTETQVTWSPKGTFLATYHKKGIALWGGEDFKQLARFAHEGVTLIDFSPSENYLVTFSPSLANLDDPNAFIIWDIRTCAKKRAFHSDPSFKEKFVWPIFKWSHDDRYFARVTAGDALSIYETPSMMLQNKKSIKIPELRSFSWSPKQNVIAYWVEEDKDVPARVTLIELPSRREIRTKNLFNVADVKMHWQKSGDYLCVKVDRYTKARKDNRDGKDKTFYNLYVNFEVFHMKEKQIPVDSIELKETVVAFAWEPVGNKFAIIHGEGGSPSVSFYGIKSGTTVTLLKKYESKPYNHLFWSPAGRFIVLAGLKVSTHQLEFIDTSDFTTTATQEHFMATDVEWDPTGRYVVTSNSYWVHRADNCYWFWTCQGRLIRKVNMDGFCQLLWRPRPPTLLPEDKVNSIFRHLNKYAPEFEKKDKLALHQLSEEQLEKRRADMAEFENYRKRRLQDVKSLKAALAQLREEREDLRNEGFEEESIEFFTKEEITEVEE